MAETSEPQDVVDVARQLGLALDQQGQDYALGGAIALGYWATPRGTLDVDLTLFLPPDKPGECIWLLQDIGCNVVATEAQKFIAEHGFCRATFGEFRVDVFLPTAPFYQVARGRRRRVDLEGQPVMIWDAECLTVFKMMFFRDKDLVDIKEMLRTQGDDFDRTWVRDQLKTTFGKRDPRLTRWDEIATDTS